MFKRFYDAFRSISTLVHSITSVDEVLELVVWKTNEVLGAKGTILRILNLETEEPDLFASYGLGEKYLSNDPVSSRKMITDLCQQNKIVIIEDIATDSRVKNKKELKKDGIQMILDVPLILRTEMLGIIGTHHWGMAVPKVGSKIVNPFPRKALLTALAHYLNITKGR